MDAHFGQNDATRQTFIVQIVYLIDQYLDLLPRQLELLPCKRYYVNAQYTSRASPDWKPVVDYVWDIAGCKA